MIWVDHAGSGRAERVAKNPVDADAHQADADHSNDGAGDHRREKPQHAADQRRNQNRDDARADDGAKNQLCTRSTRCAVGHGHHGGDRRKRHAHHDGQANTKPLRGAQGLNQRHDAAAKQVSRDQHGHLFRAELERTPDDQRHSHCAGVHHQHMLKT